MAADFDIYGVLIPRLLMLIAAALVITGIMIRLLGVWGVYRWTAHGALFNVALFLVILGGLHSLILWLFGG